MAYVNKFEAYLAESVPQINSAISEVSDEFIDNLNKIHANRAVPIANHFIDNCKGGKRIRGTLVKVGCELTYTKPNDDILVIAAALELFQTAILAHDDIVDKSELRRNKPTLHVSLGGDHNAVSNTICLADMGFFWAYLLLSKANFPPQRITLAIKVFSQMALNTVIGEIIDIELAANDIELDSFERDIITISELKTAWYTVTSPLQIGAILGGWEEDQLLQLTYVGQYLGIAFQIQDDILDIFGNTNTMGKTVGSDILEGKNTLLYQYALSVANKKQKQVLIDYYGNKDTDEKGIALVKRVFQMTGSLDYAQSKIRFYCEKAQRNIKRLVAAPEAKELLQELTYFLIFRQR